MPKPEPKYELTDQTIEFNGHTLHRIRALRDLDTPWAIVKVGELGGFVGSEDNLSHEGVCWIENQAKVFEDARASHDCRIYGRSCLNGNASVGEHAWVGEDASVGEHAWVGGFAFVGLEACVGGDTRLDGSVEVFGYVHITTGHFTSGYFRDQEEVDAYLAYLETKEPTYAQA